MASVNASLVLLLAILFTMLRGSSASPYCVTRVSTMESRYVPYWETYKYKVLGLFYKIKTRLNYKTEYYVAWHKEVTCCDGYVSVGDACRAHCHGGCEGGECTLPNVCECPAHHSLEPGPDGTGGKCVPTCTNGCVHGECVQPDVCQCEPGYWMDSDGYTCRPSCSQHCESVHAECTAPDTCTCEPGYRETTLVAGSADCEPVCDEPCTNGVCTAPNACTCEPGYEAADGLGCRSVCTQECTFGECVAPGTCACEPGYRARNASACEPVCSEPCARGTCVAPESCSCDDGYGLLESSAYECRPICATECPANAKCVEPNVCACDEGYRFRDGEREPRECGPICEPPCGPFGTCTAPGVCACSDGYRLFDGIHTSNEIPQRNRTSLCEPICEPPCANAECTKPGECTCNPGYRPPKANVSSASLGWTRPSLTEICEPVCVTPCGENSTCVAPNTCWCSDGYVFVGEVRGVKLCEPVCELPCQRGFCAAPGVCVCNEGHAKDDRSGSCEPLCDPPCDNGTCVGPNECNCDDGYVPGKLANGTSCEPFCESGCEHGRCLAPGVCECREGFAKTANDTGARCVAVCDRECNGHGRCFDAETGCQCDFGWTGIDCGRRAFCHVLLETGRKEHEDVLERITVANETNSALAKARDSPLYCRECADSVDNETLCYSTGTIATPVVCFVNTDSPCYTRYQYSALTNVSTITGSAAAGIIFVLACSGAIAYFTMRRLRRKKMEAAASVQGSLLHGTVATESLISEEAEYL